MSIMPAIVHKTRLSIATERQAAPLGSYGLGSLAKLSAAKHEKGQYPRASSSLQLCSNGERIPVAGSSGKLGCQPQQNARRRLSGVMN